MACKERAKDSQDSLLFGSGLLSFLLTSAGITGICPRDSRIGVGIRLLHVSSDGLELVFRCGGLSWKEFAGWLVGGGSRLHLSGGRVIDETLLGLAVASWEQDQFRLVRVQSLCVQLQLFLTGRGSSVVDRDSDSAGEGGAQAGSLELGQSEATAVSDLAGVLARARGDHGSELLDGPREHFAAFLLSALQSSQLLRWLVEVHSDTPLPVFAEMYVWDDVVVLDHC